MHACSWPSPVNASPRYPMAKKATALCLLIPAATQKQPHIHTHPLSNTPTATQAGYTYTTLRGHAGLICKGLQAELCCASCFNSSNAVGAAGAPDVPDRAPAVLRAGHVAAVLSQGWVLRDGATRRWQQQQQQVGQLPFRSRNGPISSCVAHRHCNSGGDTCTGLGFRVQIPKP